MVLILPKMSGFVKTLNLKNGDEDKNNKLMSFCTDDDRLLEKYKTTWSKNEGLRNIKLNALTVYDDRFDDI